MTNLDNLNDIVKTKELIKENMQKVIVGQDEIIDNFLISILCGGHILLVGVPGLAKTLLISAFSKTLQLDFKRIQFTPDLMPSDILGTEILKKNITTGEKEFQFLKGPIFSNIILADEINRTPPKTQAALLQAMQEYEVSIGNKTFELNKPFFVLATQNPIEQEGTYPLPEAQLDRFFFNLIMDYPTYEEELLIADLSISEKMKQIKPVLKASDIIRLQKLIREMPITKRVIEFAVKLIRKSRPKDTSAHPITKEMVNWGAGPRATQSLVLAAKAHAALSGRATPDIIDIKSIAKSVLRHRILPNFKALAEGITSDDIIDELLKEN